MSAVFVAAAGISVLAVFFFLVESESLSEGHARVRAQILNAARWAFVIALAWVSIPVAFSQSGPQRGPTILSLAVLIGALVLVPVRWFVLVGGREPTWELRRAKIETTQLANRVRRDPASVGRVKLTDAIDRVTALRTPATSELCDLLVAELADLLRGAESWNEAGRRTIRIDELSRRLWPGAIPPPDYDSFEATFRWRMYRSFGELIEAGSAEITPASADEFRRHISDLGRFRRPDTEGFIDDVKASAMLWLAERADGPWIEGLDFSALGPNGLDYVKQLWGRDAALWGAELDDADRQAIEADLATRAQPPESQPAQVDPAQTEPQGEMP
jgi:hypothetical protein